MASAKRRKQVGEAAAEYVPAQEGLVVSATEFKARCLELMTRIERTREEVIVTRYGKAVAKLVVYEEKPQSLLGYTKGSVAWYGDIISPLDEPWNADIEANDESE